MQIAELMTQDVWTCRQTDMLDRAAQLMWEHDIGVLPVLDDFGMLVGIVTDRDACMAAFMQRQPLHALPVSVAMSKHVVTCRPEDTTSHAAELMAKHRVRRLAVVDDDEHAIGVLSLSDLARAAAHHAYVPESDVARTLDAICEQRAAASSTATAPATA